MEGKVEEAMVEVEQKPRPSPSPSTPGQNLGSNLIIQTLLWVAYYSPPNYEKYEKRKNLQFLSLGHE